MFFLGLFDNLLLLGGVFGEDADKIGRNGRPKFERLRETL